tara:strand:+ start:67 stop:264 length:198 start_codon:yes stop_codon:yes gene_type:complete
MPLYWPVNIYNGKPINKIINIFNPSEYLNASGLIIENKEKEKAIKKESKKSNTNLLKFEGNPIII